MPAGKRHALVFDKPFEELEFLDLMMFTVVDEIYEINMPYLKYLYISLNGAKNLPVSSLKHLEELYVDGGDFGYFSGGSLANIRFLTLGNCGLTYCDFQNLSQMYYLSVGSNSELTWIDINGCYSLNYLHARYCSFSSDAIESITYDLVNSGQLNGSLYLDYGNNAIPNPAAQISINILVSRGWNVYTN